MPPADWAVSASCNSFTHTNSPRTCLFKIKSACRVRDCDVQRSPRRPLTYMVQELNVPSLDRAWVQLGQCRAPRNKCASQRCLFHDQPLPLSELPLAGFAPHPSRHPCETTSCPCQRGCKQVQSNNHLRSQFTLPRLAAVLTHHTLIQLLAAVTVSTLCMPSCDTS